MGKATVRSYENGAAAPKAEELIKLARLFDVRVDYLLKLEKGPVLCVSDLGKH